MLFERCHNVNTCKHNDSTCQKKNSQLFQQETVIFPLATSWKFLIRSFKFQVTLSDITSWADSFGANYPATEIWSSGNHRWSKSLLNKARFGWWIWQPHDWQGGRIHDIVLRRIISITSKHILLILFLDLFRLCYLKSLTILLVNWLLCPCTFLVASPEKW